MLGAERDGEGNLREVSVEFVAVEFVAVAQQHAEQKDGNMQNNKKSAAVFLCGAFINRYCTCD